MSDVIRRPSADGKHMMQGWGLSLLLHLAFVLSAVTDDAQDDDRPGSPSRSGGTWP